MPGEAPSYCSQARTSQMFLSDSIVLIPYHVWYSAVYLPTSTIKINHSCRYKYTTHMDGMGMNAHDRLF